MNKLFNDEVVPGLEKLRNRVQSNEPIDDEWFKETIAMLDRAIAMLDKMIAAEEKK